MNIEQLWREYCDLDNKCTSLQEQVKIIIARHPEGAIFNWSKSNDKEEVTRLHTEINELDKQRYKIEDEIIKELNGSFFQLSNRNVLTQDGESGDKYIVERTPYKRTVC